MKEAALILPTTDNNGRDLTDLVRVVETDLVEAFGGFTHTYGRGAYKADDGSVHAEMVNVYTIAMEDSFTSAIQLRRIAKLFAAEAEQECVYVRYPNGAVSFVRHNLQEMAV